ncbi:hypothetical protein MNV_1010015 [Candidatus Methanoperedens nitroreducens]|uniref:Uncharacterized protein n=1 Tax=Candidatus Methanoperedens nitratireducens TaxID=1392998 RepID=A0A284VI69_9EURY|nr:hypothetical protein MNV_1010015 [Candidatus Methanoperedens nitroreducens]
MRILCAQIKPGVKTKRHSHSDHVVYVLSNHKSKTAKGKSNLREEELPFLYFSPEF